ncbi:hypothetical protein FKM82_002422 [Ascaphus truei]
MCVTFCLSNPTILDPVPLGMSDFVAAGGGSIGGAAAERDHMTVTNAIYLLHLYLYIMCTQICMHVQDVWTWSPTLSICIQKYTHPHTFLPIPTPTHTHPHRD